MHGSANSRRRGAKAAPSARSRPPARCRGAWARGPGPTSRLRSTARASMADAALDDGSGARRRAGASRDPASRAPGPPDRTHPSRKGKRQTKSNSKCEPMAPRGRAPALRAPARAWGERGQGASCVCISIRPKKSKRPRKCNTPARAPAPVARPPPAPAPPRACALRACASVRPHRSPRGLGTDV